MSNKQQINHISKFYMWIAICSVALAIILIVVSSFYDWNISEALALPYLDITHQMTTNIYGLIMFIIGDVFLGLIPGVLAIIVVFFTAYRIQHRVRKIVCKVILIIILVALIFGQFYGALINLFDVLKAFYHPGDQMMLIIEIVVPLILGLGIAPLLLWLFSKIQIGYIQNMWKWAVAAIIILIINMLIIQVLKTSLPRERFYSNVFNTNGGDEQLFVPWYLLGQHTNASGKSFPSGHTQQACSLLCIVSIPLFIKCNKKRLCLLTIIPFLLIFAVMIGRIVAGAHYLSDVSYAFLICSIITISTYYATIKLKRKMNK